MNRIQVGPNRWIGEGEEPYVIAEIGINHNGSFDLCKKMIDSAQKRWADIKSEENLLPLSNVSVVEKKENLKSLLEDIRENIESLLSYSHCALLAKVCRKFLERIFLISENLGASYAFAGYNESYYILDTIRIAEGFYKKR